MPSIAIALSISEKYVPLFQSVAALGTISLVVYTFGKEFKKNGWFVKMWDGIAYFFYLLFLIIFYFPMRWTRKSYGYKSLQEFHADWFHDIKFWK